MIAEITSGKLEPNTGLFTQWRRQNLVPGGAQSIVVFISFVVIRLISTIQ